MEYVIGIVSIVVAFVACYAIYVIRDKIQDHRTSRASQKHKEAANAPCLCPSCKIAVNKAIANAVESRGRNKTYEDLQMTCPYCSVVVLWDVMGNPPVAKEVYGKQKRDGGPSPDKDQKRSAAPRANIR